MAAEAIIMMEENNEMVALLAAQDEEGEEGKEVKKTQFELQLHRDFDDLDSL